MSLVSKSRKRTLILKKDGDSKNKILYLLGSVCLLNHEIRNKRRNTLLKLGDSTMNRV